MDRGLLADFKLLWLVSQQLSKADKMNLVMTVEGDKGHRPLSPAHTPERATPILGLWFVMAFFTDRFILKYILEHFKPQNGSSTPSISALEEKDIKREN